MTQPSSELDCTRCGACCVNPRENEAEGFRSWVAVEPGAPLLRRRDLVRKLVVLDERGDPHLRLDATGRCLALRGALAREVRCAIYAQRPHGCRRVQAGAPDCLRYRAEHGLGGATGGAPAGSGPRRRRGRRSSDR